MLEIRITNYESDGSEKETDWQIDPLKQKEYRLLVREQGTTTSGILRRRPYSEQFVRKVTFGAGLFASQESKDAFERMLRAHRIEFVTGHKGKQKIYTEFSLDAEEEIEYEYLEETDIIELAWKELKFIETNPRWFTKWYPK